MTSRVISRKRVIEGVEVFIARVRALYKIISEDKPAGDPESVQARIGIVRELEKLLGTDFKDTQDFHFKIHSFLIKGRSESPGLQLKKARKKIKWSQVDLATNLECSRSYIALMETNKKPLLKKAVKFVELANFPVFNKPLIIKQLREPDEN